MSIRKIADILKEREQTLSFEFFPPKTQKGRLRLYEAAHLLKDLQPDYISVTYGAGGSTRELTMDIVDQLQKKFGISTMHHLTCVAHSRQELIDLIDRMKEKNIKNVLALYGDIPETEGEYERTESELQYCYELCHLLREHGDYFSIGVAGFPEGHIDSPDRKTDIRYLKMKLEAGADFVITQLFFENRDYFDYVRMARAAGIKAKIIPGIITITSYNNLVKFCRKCGAKIPERVHKIFKPIAADADETYKRGLEFSIKQCQQLLDRGAPGLHFFTLNKADPAREIVKNIKFSKR